MSRSWHARTSEETLKELGTSEAGLSQTEAQKRLTENGPNELKKEKTIFMASHLLFEVSETCEKVALIDRGKLLAFDYVEKLENVFSSQRIQVEVLKPLEPSEVEAIRSLRGVTKVVASGNTAYIDFKGDKETQASILADLVEMAIKVASFRPALGSLEEVYMRIVKGGE
jgi:ABC-2 type transport system ATP-binding protein